LANDAVAVPLFVTVIVQLNVPFRAMLPLTLFVLLTVKSGATTVIEALAVLPVPPFVEVTLPVKLFFTPSPLPVTVTLKVQLPFAAIVPPVKAIVPVTAVVVKLFVPPHTLAVPSTTDKPRGKTSVNATPVKAVAVFGLVIVKLRVVVLPSGTVAAPNDFEIEGGATTVTVSEPMLFASLLSAMFPFGSTVAVFTRLPAETGVTVKLTTKLPVVPPIVTEPPLAVHARVPATIVQLILPEFVILLNVPTLGTP